MLINYIGPDQINLLLEKTGRNILPLDSIPMVNYDEEKLSMHAKEYILEFGTDVLDILDIRNFFGVDPEISESCLYNQDWYMSEDFIRRRMDNK